VSTWQPSVWVDGHLQPADRPAVLALDAGLRSGVGVFETMRADGVRIVALSEHLARLIAGGQRLGIPIDPNRAVEGIATLLALPRPAVHRAVVVRVTGTAGALPAGAPVGVPAAAPTGQHVEGVGPGHLVVTLHAAPPVPSPPAAAVTVAARRWPADVKATSYLASVLAIREAQARGAEVALLADGDELLEAADGNLFLVLTEGLLTPTADGRLLAGVTRGRVLAAAARAGVTALESPITPVQVARAGAAFVTSAARGLRQLTNIDTTVFPADGPVAREAQRTIGLIAAQLAAEAAAAAAVSPARR
jgi:branched-chain amino acid aminotransferase